MLYILQLILVNISLHSEILYKMLMLIYMCLFYYKFLELRELK